MLHPASERPLGQGTFPQPLALHQLSAERAVEVEHRDGEFEQSGIGREPDGTSRG